MSRGYSASFVPWLIFYMPRQPTRRMPTYHRRRAQTSLPTRHGIPRPTCITCRARRQRRLIVSPSRGNNFDYASFLILTSCIPGPLSSHATGGCIIARTWSAATCRTACCIMRRLPSMRLPMPLFMLMTTDHSSSDRRCNAKRWQGVPSPQIGHLEMAFRCLVDQGSVSMADDRRISSLPRATKEGGKTLRSFVRSCKCPLYISLSTSVTLPLGRLTLSP